MKRVFPFVLLGACLSLSACGEQVSPEEQARRDAEAVAAVKRANAAIPPLEEVVPEPILYPDLEQHDLYGLACSYAPGTSLATRVVTRAADAFVKIDGEMLRFAADPGSRELPGNTRTLYNGRAYSLRLEIEGDGTAIAEGSGATRYSGTVHLRDRWNRTVYTGTGTVDCGA
ncbi:hypothetical protein [Alteraurantiacibacter palmitatis]|uniref:Uncharacterized protein n=1 Tax=Alteraurantiacibacter palmitatis TaxID=2054628 RepID=A0ABV7E8J2_9SPHN